MKKILLSSLLSLGLIAAFLWSPSQASGNSEDVQIIEMNSHAGFTLVETEAFVHGIDFKPFEFRGEVQVAG